MKQQFLYDDKHEFLQKLQDLVDSGMGAAQLDTVTPFPMHEAEEILRPPKSPLRFFALIGALTGLIAGFAFTIYTVQHWPLITGGKPLVSIPAFMIIAFELTILFGALLSFAGFLFLSRLPNVGSMIESDEYGNQFAILVNDEG